MIIDKEAHDKALYSSAKKFGLGKPARRAYTQAVMDYNAGGSGYSIIEIEIPHGMIETEARALNADLHRSPISWFEDIVTQYFNRNGVCLSVEKSSYKTITNSVFNVRFKINTPG